MFSIFNLKPYPKIMSIRDAQKSDKIKIGNDFRKVLGLPMYKEKVKTLKKTTIK